jgi:hypothetical protein
MSSISSTASLLAAAVALACAAPGELAQGSNAPAAAGNATNGARAVPARPMQAQPMPHGIVPNRAELPGSAFQKLDSENKGYVTLDDVAQLQGFESAFRQADQNHDGRLNMSEFSSAWATWTGNTP